MAEKDYIIRDLIFKYEGLFDIDNIYKNIKSFLKKNLSYPLLNEKTYDEKRHDDLKDTKIKLEAFKKVDDYTKLNITVKINSKDCKDVAVKGKKLQKGQIKIEFESVIETDYLEKWAGKSMYKKFFRAVYDKYIMESKQNRLTKQIKDETYMIYNELKDTLK